MENGFLASRRAFLLILSYFGLSTFFLRHDVLDIAGEGSSQVFHHSAATHQYPSTLVSFPATVGLLTSS